jgi:hypothetical protein
MVATNNEIALDALWAGCVLVAAVLIAMLFHARAVVTIAMNH